MNENRVPREMICRGYPSMEIKGTESDTGEIITLSNSHNPFCENHRLKPRHPHSINTTTTLWMHFITTSPPSHSLLHLHSHIIPPLLPFRPFALPLYSHHERIHWRRVFALNESNGVEHLEGRSYAMTAKTTPNSYERKSQSHSILTRLPKRWNWWSSAHPITSWSITMWQGQKTA